MKLGASLRVAAIVWSVVAPALAAESAARFQVETRIPLGEVRGRIDHLAIDLQGRRLFVAELGNGSVAVVDLERRAVQQRLTGFQEPQGLGWLPRNGTLFVASAGDGSVRAFAGSPFAESARVKLGDDADNVRVEPDQRRVDVGFGSGAIAMLEADALPMRSDVGFSGHPESFQMEGHGARVFVNVPGARQVVVLDRATRKVLDRWPTGGLGDNYAMALDEAASKLFVVFRQPAVLGAFSTATGKLVSRVETCADADDVFIDAKRGLVHVVCGDGHVATHDLRSPGLARIAVTSTVPGARTGLFSPELDRLFVAVRASGSEPAAIWVLRPIEAVIEAPGPAAR